MKKTVFLMLIIILLVGNVLVYSESQSGSEFPQEAIVGDCLYRITGFSYIGKIGYYQAGRFDVNSSSDYYESGNDAEFAVLWADIVNQSEAAVNYLDGCEVKVYEGETNVYDGWAAQQNYDNFAQFGDDYGEDSGKQNKRWVINPSDNFAIPSQGEGHYLFVCNLLNSVVNGTESLKMVITLQGGKKVTYEIRESQSSEVVFSSKPGATNPTAEPVLIPTASPEPTSEPVVVASEAQYVAATGGDSNIRSGPSLGYSTIGSMAKGSGAPYLNESSIDDRGVAWYKIDYNGRTGWVSSRYTMLRNGTWNGGTTSVSSSSNSSNSTSHSYVKGTSGKSNLRTGPGLSYNEVGVLHKGETATFLNETSTDDRGVVWYKVSFDGNTCWVSSKYTTLY